MREKCRSLRMRKPPGGNARGADDALPFNRMLKRTLILGLAMSLALAPPFTAVASAQSVGDFVELVVVEGNRQYGKEVITHAAKLKPGDLLSDERLRSAFNAIWKTSFFDDVTIATSPGERGTIVYITVVEKPIVRNVEFRGNKSITRSAIDELLEERSVILPTDAPLDRARLKNIEDLLRQLADEKGFRFADIDLELEEVTPGVVRAVFQIDEGTKVRINDVKFVGNEVFSNTRLKYTMKKTREHWFLSWLTSHDILSQATFGEDLQRLQDLYLNRGYIDLQIGEPKIEVFEYKVTRKGKIKRRINIEIPIEEGERYRVKEIKVTGNEEFDSETLLKLVPLRVGDVYSKELLAKGRDNIDDAYGARGYYKVFTSPGLIPYTDENLVDVVLDVSEDKIYYVRSFEFSGNDATQDRVIRREVLLEEGKVFNTRRFRNSLIKLNQLGYFAIKDVPEINEVPGTNEVDILIKGEEVGRNEINVGGGYSGSLGFFGTLSFATRNFMGRGEALSVNVQSGADSDTYSLSFTEPWLFDRPISTGASIFKRETEFTDFTRDGRGGEAIIGSRIGSFSSWRLRYSFEDVEVSERVDTPDNVIVADPEGNPFVPEDPDADRRKALFNNAGTTSSITPIFLFNTVNNPYDPVRGYRLRFSAEYAPEALGGGYNYVKPIFEASLFFPVNRIPHVLASHIEIGWVEGLGGVEVPVFERFFLGGERTIRGLDLRSVSPVDSGGFRIGGNKMFLFNQEYHIPIAGSPLKGVLFFDAGNAYDDDDSLDLSDLRMTAGVELRITLPVLGQPLRFIYGYNLDPEEGEDQGDFQFTIGSAF